MYKIKFKGSFDDIEVSDDRGIKLKEDFSRGKLKDMIEINDGLYDTKSIKAVQPMGGVGSTASKEKNAKYLAEIDKEYLRDREIALSREPAERGKNLGLFHIVWFAETGKTEAPSEIKEAVIKRQVKYFEENPRKTEVSPTCYKDLLEEHKNTFNLKSNKNYKPLSETARVGAMSFVERVLHTDMKYSRK